VKRIVVLGSAVLDHRVWVAEWPPVRRRTPATAYVEDLGGGGAVAAATVARLDGGAMFVGLLGDDPAGTRVAALLQAHGVDTRYVTVRPGSRTAVSSIVIVPGGERFIVAYPGEGPRDEPDWVPLDALDGADAVLIDSRLPRAATALARAARARRLPVVLDFDVDAPEVWRLARLATHAIADEELAGKTGGAGALLAKLRADGVWGAVTLGPGGAVYAGGRVSAFPVNARDTTGAGDVFHGAFALALMEGQSEDGALAFASAAAAVRCETGRLPDRPAVEQLLMVPPAEGGG
jgi:sulfofructose kinase